MVQHYCALHPNKNTQLAQILPSRNHAHRQNQSKETHTRSQNSHIHPKEERARNAYTKRPHSQHQTVQIPLHNHILHTLHRLIQQISIRRVGEVDVNLFARVADQVPELAAEELGAGVDVAGVGGEVREVGGDGGGSREEFLAEEVHFVEEEDEGGFLEVFAVGDGFE